MIENHICRRLTVAAVAGRKRGFTLFEVLLAIALSTLLLALIGAAINLYLTRIEARRTDVEFSQLARTIFEMIGDDLRAAAEYKPQDMSGAMAASGASSGVSQSLDSTSTGTSSTSGTSGTTGTTGTTGTSGTSGTTGTTTTSGTSTSSASSSTATVEAANMSTTPGVYGTLNELYIDASRPLGLNQLLAPTLVTRI